MLRALLSHLESFKMTSFHCNQSLFRIVFEKFIVSGMTLKSEIGVVQGHWKWYHSKAWVWFPIRIP